MTKQEKAQAEVNKWVSKVDELRLKDTSTMSAQKFLKHCSDLANAIKKLEAAQELLAMYREENKQ